MVIVIDEHGQILDVAIGISRSTNIFGKGMNPTILPPAAGKIG